MTLVLLLVGAAGKWVATEEDLGLGFLLGAAGRCGSRRRDRAAVHVGDLSVVHRYDGTDLAREVETFFWVWVSALGERQG